MSLGVSYNASYLDFLVIGDFAFLALQFQFRLQFHYNPIKSSIHDQEGLHPYQGNAIFKPSGQGLKTTTLISLKLKWPFSTLFSPFELGPKNVLSLKDQTFLFLILCSTRQETKISKAQS